MVIWILSLIATLLILSYTVYLAFQTRYGVMRSFYVMLSLLAGTFVIYIPNFFQDANLLSAAMANVLNTLRVLSLEVNYVESCEVISAALSLPWLAAIYHIVLGALHILLPAISAMTAVTLIMRCVTRIQLRRLRRNSRNLHVFSRVTYESKFLAADIRRNDPHAELLFLEPDNDVDHTDLRDSLNCTVLEEKIENIRARAKNRRVYYYCIDHDQEENMDAALSILSGLQTETPEVQRNNYIFLFTRDPMAETMIDSLDKGLVEIDVVNDYQNAAYQLLIQHPLTDIGMNNEIFVVLCGFSDMNLETLRAVSWSGQISGYHLKIRLLGALDQAKVDTFKQQYPGLFSDIYDIEFLDCPNQSCLQQVLRQHCADVDYIVVAEDSEKRTIEQSVFLRRFYYMQDPEFKAAPQIYAYIPNADRALAVRSLRTAEAKPERRVSYDIVPFGVVSDLYTFGNVTDSDLEKIAKNVHLMYEDIFSDGPIDAVDAIRRYNLFEVNKRSNRANALHIRYKLFMLGLDYTDDPNAEEVELKDYLDEEELERLTFAEHDRWQAFLESEGWVTATIEQVQAYQASGISRGRHNCPLLKMHPYICPFDELKARSDALGLPDSRVYDRELIARIPEILHDKWGITGKSYKIIKKQ